MSDLSSYERGHMVLLEYGRQYGVGDGGECMVSLLADLVQFIRGRADLGMLEGECWESAVRLANADCGQE